MNILFNKNGRPYKKSYITRCIRNFGSSYKETVYFIIRNTAQAITEDIFKVNCARLLSNFKMTRQGPFKGIKWDEANIVDPKGKLALCWHEVGEDLILARNFLNGLNLNPRSRVLVLLDKDSRIEVVTYIWKAFKKLLPITMGKYSYGLVGASKILFSVLPEIVQPVDNAEWLNVFKTVDFGDVINTMADEIMAWEEMTGEHLQNCDYSEYTTLPAVYNVMAMEARPKK